MGLLRRLLTVRFLLDLVLRMEIDERVCLAVWFSVFIAALLGLLAFAGDAAIGAVFSVCEMRRSGLNYSNYVVQQISVIGLYIAVRVPFQTASLCCLIFLLIVHDPNWRAIHLQGTQLQTWSIQPGRIRKSTPKPYLLGHSLNTICNCRVYRSPLSP